MARARSAINNVRASRDGHEYHEAWTARYALQLVWPTSKLTAIAVEGLSPTDQASASKATSEIADITLYYGGNPTFAEAGQTTFIQFKYSIASKDKEFRASDAKETIRKFGRTYLDYKRRFGRTSVTNKLHFRLITNQPVSKSFQESVEAIASTKCCSGDEKKQAEQFTKASGLAGQSLAKFARNFKVVGSTSSLPEIKIDLTNILVDWSATRSPIAVARLGKLRELVREKAGYSGTSRNLIKRTDVLAALGIDDPTDLLPCKSRLPETNPILKREQFQDALTRVSQTNLPLLIQASGGIGKTVFLSSLANKLTDTHEVVFFDCFAGGAYRSPEDARHLPKNGLIHIANELAFSSGLCDPMFPGSTDVQGLMKTFRRRIRQCLETTAKLTPIRKLVLVIDAIDNAVIAAKQRSEDCFPIMLLESLDIDPIPGFHLIVSCRPERNPITNIRHEILDLQPFTKAETTAFLRKRLKNPSNAKISVAQARSGGNARILEYILKSDHKLLDVSEIDHPTKLETIELENLIEKYVTDALYTATTRGLELQDVDAFLAGLTVLPPPVPLTEYAIIHDIDLKSFESFASDLHPLLERTSQGIIFRDEPTETFVSKRYASSSDVLCRVASKLFKRQDVSVYAATALPNFLHRLDKSEQLFALAFDNRIPSTITSTVGKRNIRYARLKAAALHATRKKDHNKLVQLLLEFSTIAVTDQRGSSYICDHPDLVVAARDVDATRRLFEEKTGWPGTRHARLAIANALSGELDESCRHAYKAAEWIEHYVRTQRQDSPSMKGPAHTDIAALPFFWISNGQGEKAGHFLNRIPDYHAYKVCELIFTYTNQAQSISGELSRRTSRFIGTLSSIGTLAAMLSFCDFPRAKRKDLVRCLARYCKRASNRSLLDTDHRDGCYQLQDGLCKSAVISLSLGMLPEASEISLCVPHKRPHLWAFQRSASYHRDVFLFLFRIAVCAAVKKNPVHEKDLLPQELASVCSRIGRHVTGKAFYRKAENALTKYAEKISKNDGQNATSRLLSSDDLEGARKFVAHHLELLFTLTRSFADVLRASPGRADKPFCELIEAWDRSLENCTSYLDDRREIFFRLLGFDLLFFAFWSRSDFNKVAIKQFLSAIQKHGTGLNNLIQIVAILAQRRNLRELAGKQAIKIATLIEKEDEVDFSTSLFGALARAMLPASIEESSLYFRRGLERLDAIGSGDYEFTNELLLFASEINGNELDEKVFHTLTNICELNIGEDPENFPWGSYGRGVSRVAGLRGLAKLCRWDDRSTIGLNSTLLPYLIGLLERGKISGRDAVALKRLVDPIEYNSAGTKEFVEALRQCKGCDPASIEELCIQFQDDSPDGTMSDNTKMFSTLSTEILGVSSELSRNLVASHLRYEEVEGKGDELNNQDRFKDLKSYRDMGEMGESLGRIVSDTDPIDEASLTDAIGRFNDLDGRYGLKRTFFGWLRDKVPYESRGKYIRSIAALDNLFFHWKIAELKDAKTAWKESSATLADIYAELAKPLIEAHFEDFINHGKLSGSTIREISEVTGVAISDLTIELIKVCVRLDRKISGTVWLGLATSICVQAEARYGQLALERLLTSEAAKPVESVPDGAWSPGLYPPDEFSEIAGSMVWRALGSPDAIDRWRATHCLRVFAKFSRWEVIDCVVAKVEDVDAGPFQARELPFFYMHANLWLLIALARIARDFPDKIAGYKTQLLSYILEEREGYHFLIRHFARQTLVTCMDANDLNLDEEIARHVREEDRPSHRSMKRGVRHRMGRCSIHQRVGDEAEFEFGLDYDFQRIEVDNLSNMFGKPRQKIEDMISGIVHRIDRDVTCMWDTAGRESRYGEFSYETNRRYDTYGQYLAWHSLLITATKLIRDYPVIDEEGDDRDAWDEWISRYCLTRDDGLWLSDGIDRNPLEKAVYLLEDNGNERAVTGDCTKILSLALLSDGVGEQFVIDGYWLSADNVRIYISSALVDSGKSAELARELIKEEPIHVFLPCVEASESGSEFVIRCKKGYTPWIVCPSGGMGLDKHDPYGVLLADCRPYLTGEISDVHALCREDPFGCVWRDEQGEKALTAEVWRARCPEGFDGRRRLCCSSSLLRKILTESNRDLLVLIKLERYEKEFSPPRGKFTHTVAVARITKECRLRYFEGEENQVLKTQW